MITIDIDKATNMSGDNSLYVSFPYDANIINIIRELPSRAWLADSKEWEIPLNKLDYLLTNLSEYDFDIYNNVDLTPKSIEVPNEFEFKTKPFSHQIEGFNYGLANDRWLLGDEQGLGKTKQVIDIAIAKKMQKGYKHCLIICGVNGLKWNWQNEILTHSNETGWILGQRKTSNNKIKIGSTKDKLYDLNNLPNDYFLITNVESLRDDEIANTIANLCKDGTIGLVAADEVHKMKNPSSQQGKGFLKIKSECRIAMTGTPLMNTPMDLYIILKWLGYENHAFYSFKNHYCVMGGFGGYQIVGYRYLDELQDRLNDIMLRRLKGDVLDLPEKTYIDEYVDMTPKQTQLYKEIAMDIMANIDQIKMQHNPLAELIRMRQATGYTGILSSTIQESAKLDRMVELVEDSIANGKKVVIFSNWTQMTDAIDKTLASHSLSAYSTIITGETKDNERQERVEAFQNRDDIKIIVGTIGAMGTGLTLTSGTVVIFLDHPWTRAAYDQAVDRCHRIGQNNNITVYNLLCKNTIDERIWEIVNKKGAMSDTLVDGKVTGNATELINYLLS